MMLSEIGRFALIDDTEWRAKLVDLCIDLSVGDYPLVTHVIYRTPSQEQRGQEQRALPWDAVKAIDETTRQIRVADLASGEQAPRESLKQAVLLSRDILDALILDLENRRAARANDLWLEHQGNRLYLSAADTSLSAILRRLSRGRLAHGRDRGLYDWKYVEFLRGDPHVLHVGAPYHSRIWRLPPGQIARMTDALPYLHAAELLKLLPDRVASDTLEAMMPERQLQVLEELVEDARLRLLALMRPDIAADLIGRLDTELARRCLERLPDVQRERIIELLRYPGDTAGGIMNNEIVTAPATLTVAQARRMLRDRFQEPDFVHFIYAVDDEETQRLRGVISLRDLIIADDEARLEDIMNPYLETIQPLESAQAAARRVIDSELAALPVVERDRRLLGVVTFDIAVPQIAPQSWRSQAPKIFT